MSDPWAEAAREAREIEIGEAAFAADLEVRSKAFREKWPQAAKCCGGWGGQTHYSNCCGWDFDICECVEKEPTKCPRCAAIGLDEDGNGPCKSCEWNYDDGDPAANC